MLFETFSTPYLWVKWVHIVSVITWMAALFYLPRLYVYHAQLDLATDTGKAQSELFKVMERRLLRGIMNPSLFAVLISGALMAPNWISHGWLHAKLLMVLFMLGCHGAYARWRKDFEADRNQRSHKFYRIANEVPTILLLIIAAMVVVKPF
ncbi:protoporphyrinogen oxidase HemJ [Insolitispirillum peregrinum]|uniref:Protoporphyrinogen IX oxidase n=1 Tax=Insolitispirillum peregrinum TaxID=80876 RepID=A0A1N7JDY6_9PROT|nr:protoporphyrinogen oxidase HemJ [Insolitispirillum peregrinum]SIS47528.1 putative membrane protein [Insolitispirillum peregrinum]